MAANLKINEISRHANRVGAAGDSSRACGCEPDYFRESLKLTPARQDRARRQSRNIYYRGPGSSQCFVAGTPAGKYAE